MPRSKQKRSSSIEVTIVDTEPLLASIFEDLSGRPGADEDMTGVTTFGDKLGYVKTPKGIFVLNGDGCSPDGDEGGITDSRSTKLPIYFEYERDGRRSMSGFPMAETTMDIEFIDDLTTKGTENLATFVRTFGHRLEVNFGNWNRFLQEAMREDASA